MATRSALRFDKRLIDTMPTPIAIALQQLTNAAQSGGKSGKNAQNVLWNACDTVELILRLLVCMAIAELHQQHRLAEVAAELAHSIDRPTLGLWRKLLARVARQLGSDTMLHELKAQLDAGWPLERFFSGDPKVANAKDDPLQSFLALRNRLAHGGGLTHGLAMDLLTHWEEPIRSFLGESLWMRELLVVGSGSDGRQCRLRGLAPQALPGTAVDLRPCGEMVSVERAGRVLQVWPLICYGLPQQLAEHVATRPVVQLYARRSAIDTLQYTPFDFEADAEAYWSFGDRRATRELDDMLTREKLAKAAESAVGAAASFADELSRDSKQMIGRESELQCLLDALEAHRGEMLWLHGDPGSGKSTLMAKLAIRLLDRAIEHATEGKLARRVLPFRFKVGDWRCTTQAFCQLIEQAIEPALAQSSQRAYTVTSTAEALKATAASGIDCVLLLDGLDEIDSTDQGFVTDVCLRLVNELSPERLGAGAGRVTWVCAGREQLTERMLRAGAVRLFESGLPGMSSEDIRALLLDRIGKARARLLEKDRITSRNLADIAASLALVKALDEGQVPSQIAAICNLAFGADELSPPTSLRLRALPVMPGKKWIIEDNANNSYNEMYIVDLNRSKSHLGVHADHVESPFINEISRRSKGLPIYVRCFINDVISGGESATFEPHKLPISLEAFYQQLIERSRIGDVTTLLTPVVCLIAVARESLSDAQLLVCVRDHLQYRQEQDGSSDLTTALVHLSPMLRRSMDRRKVAGYMIYHKSFRDYLDPPATQSASDVDGRFARNNGVKNSIFTAKHWLCEKIGEAAKHGIEHAGPFSDYVAHNGVDHLLEIDSLDPKYNGIARALQLYATLAERTELERHDIRPAALHVMAKRIADAVNTLVEQMRSGETLAQRQQARERAAALPVHSLLVLIHDVYETGTRKGAIRVLADLHNDVWDTLRQELHSPYDMVLRIDTGEVLAELWEDADEEQRAARLSRLVAMTDDPLLEEREIAGYALEQVYLQAPEHMDMTFIKRWAGAETNIERMILGELILSMAGEHPDQASRLEAAIPPTEYPAFWRPVWDYHRVDLDAYRVLVTDPAQWPALAAGEDDPSLAICARGAQELQAFLATLRARNSVQARPALVRLLTPEGFGALGRDASVISDVNGETFAQLRSLLEGADRTVGLDILKAVMEHPIWRVPEAAASALERLVESDPEHMSLIQDLVKDDAARWRVCYAAIDASFNIGARDDFALFESAIKLHANHGCSRVRGICADDFLAWLRMGDAPTRARILSDPKLCAVLKSWVSGARDSWLLEYIYLIIRHLDQELQHDVAPFLEDGVSELMQGDPPFYQCEREEFLVRIEHNSRVLKLAG